MKRLLLLAAATVAASLVLALAPRDRGPEGEAPAAPTPVHRVEIELTAEGIAPYRIPVPKNHEVHLVVRGAPGAGEGMFTVTGYGDRVAPVAMGPGLSRELVFLADRPGDDFAFTMNGDVLGRLEVTGSHLEEGHR